MTRSETSAAALRRRGITDPVAAGELLTEWPEGMEPVLDRLADVADPDLALSLLDRLRTARPGLLEQLRTDERLTLRLLAVLGGSEALGLHLVRHLDLLGDLDGELRLPPRGEIAEVLGAADGEDALRLAYRRLLLRVAVLDLTSPDPLTLLPALAATLADLADGVLQAALDLARRQTPDADLVRLAVVGLGKCGARELNYLSDVDVLFVAEPALDGDGEPRTSSERAVAVGARLAAALSRTCSGHGAAGTIWEVDAALRPEGRAGPLVRSLASMQGYYRRWAKPWEFQAMLKARPVAGDLDLGAQFVALVAEGVWTVGDRQGFVAEVQAMRRRVVELIPARESGRELKLGEGGLRDVEFTVQLLQLVHGRTDPSLRVGATLDGLATLVAGGYVGRADGAELAAAYRWERLAEHRLQLFRLRRTHLLPAEDEALRRLARGLGLSDGDAVVRTWRETSRRVLSLHRRIFYSPLLAAVADVGSEHVALGPVAARDWLRALGFADPGTALADIAALTQGVRRSAGIQRQLLPAMLRWFAEAPAPDLGLRAFREVSEALGGNQWYLRALRDEGAMAQRLARILASSRYAVQLLRRSPEAVQLLASPADLVPRSHAQLCEATRASGRRHPDAARAVLAIRSVRRRELFRVAAADVLGLLDLEQVGQALTDVTTACVEASLEAVEREIGGGRQLGLVALGRWGGQEMSYASDADVVFVVPDGLDEPQRAGSLSVLSRLRRLLQAPGPDPALVLDADLRPEGKGGPLLRSLVSYQSYYRRWSATWESQAVLRATVGGGDARLAAELLAVMDPLRYPEGGLSEPQRQEIRRLKARMEAERLPRGASRGRHTKLGPGGLSDVEWTVQLLQLDHAHRVPALRTTSTLTALRAAREHDLLDETDAETLEQAWVLASRVRNTAMLVRGKAADTFPTDPVELAAVAELLGHGSAGGSHLLEDYARLTRRARAVVDRIFWGEG